ncbi:MAG: precorrin-2 C(20)-methyltransferase [Lachnospiraceae bacterium]|nr:precorrin-2 C(20)-methyltransferase [Lachnospiraceae bacterium]
MKQGIIYGVGVGPGDPELLTLKAARLLRECGVVAIPQEKEKCFAFRIAEGAVPELSEKPVLELVLPMTRDKEARAKAQDAAAAALAAELRQGRTVVFLTLGDPSVYSTWGYLLLRLREAGFAAETVPGVPSFSAAAAALGVPLCEDREELHILPGGVKAEDALKYPGTKVFMKGQLPALLRAASELKQPLVGAENCGTREEKLYHSLEEIPEDAGYYTLIIAKEQK